MLKTDLFLKYLCLYVDDKSTLCHPLLKISLVVLLRRLKGAQASYYFNNVLPVRKDKWTHRITYQAHRSRQQI